MFTLNETRDGQLSKECRKTFLWLADASISWSKNWPNLSSAPCIGAAQVYPSLILQQISWALFAAFCLFGRTLSIDFALLGRKRKYLKSKTTAKLAEKRTSIAAVRDILWTFGTFPTPLLSRYRLPLIVLYRPEKEICILNEKGMFKKEKEWWCHGPRPLPFSMYTITKEQQCLAFFSCSREWSIFFLGGCGGGRWGSMKWYKLYR